MERHGTEIHAGASTLEYRRIDAFDIILGYGASLAICVYLGWRLFYTLPFSYGYVAVALGLLLFFCELIAGVQAIGTYMDQLHPLPLEQPVIPDSWYPHVDVLIATHSEDVDLLYNTVNACRYLRYPDPAKVHVYICDDGNRPEMRQLAKKLGVNYVGMEKPMHAKAGNINNALKHSNSPLVAFLDADMIPRRDFLREIVPFFFLPHLKKTETGEWVRRAPEEVDPDYKVGFVQTPQNFYSPDLFQFNLYAEDRIPNEQIYFFREVNLSRNRSNSCIMCGSNMIISRQALEEVGGFSIDTITEDHETGIKIQTAGYATYAIPPCLANGLNPPTVISLVRQRERWGRGCMQVFRNLNPLFDSRIPLLRRFSYLCTVLYWLTFFCRFVFIMSPILVALFGVHIVECSLLELMMIWLPYCILHIFAMSKISERTRTVNWSNIVDTILFPFLFAPIVCELFGIKLKKFSVTEKSFSRSGGSRVLILPHLIYVLLTLFAIVLTFVEIVQYRAFFNVIILFWLLVNLKSLGLSLCFMLGRVNERANFRSNAAVAMEFEVDGFVQRGVTVDISEGGFSAALGFPLFVPPDSAVVARLWNDDYKAEMHCSLVQVRKMEGHDWVYSMKLENVDDDNLSQFMQILYDREPALPERVLETIPLVEDLKVNFDMRLKKQAVFYARKLPRIARTIRGALPNGEKVYVNDFSYQYVRVHPAVPLAPGETLAVTVGNDGITLVIEPPEERLAAQNPTLYNVVNWRDWANKEEYRKFIRQWAGTPEESEAPEDEVDLKSRSAIFTRITGLYRKLSGTGNTGAITKKFSRK